MGKQMTRSNETSNGSAMRLFRILGATSLMLALSGTASAIATPDILQQATPEVVQLGYQLQQGVEGDIEFSGLYKHNTRTGKGHYSSLAGTVVFDYDPAADLYTLVDSDLTVLNSDVEFALTGGQIRGDGSGFLDYLIAADADAVAGTFEILAGEFNSINFDTFRLMGTSNPRGNVHLDATLVGSTQAVPEPSAALLFLIGGLVLRRAKGHRAA